MKGPVILGGLREVNGKLYLPLLKGDPVLSNFLSPRPCNTRPLRATQVPEELQHLRNTFIMGRGEVEEQEEDFATDLALGGATGQKRRIRKEKAEKLLPPTVVVMHSKAGFPDWPARVLVDKWVRLAPAMEVCEFNFQSLFDRVRADLEDGEVKRARHGGAAGAARKPKGPREKRRFWKGSKWLEKRQLRPAVGAATGLDPPEAVAAGASSAARVKRTKYRTLLIAPSDAQSPPRSRGRPRRTQPIAPRTEADPPAPATGLEDAFAL